MQMSVFCEDSYSVVDNFICQIGLLICELETTTRINELFISKGEYTEVNQVGL